MNNKNQLPPALFLMGPTASGKTHLAIELLKHFPCEIISVDSAQVYKGMDIGTAKPDTETLKQAPHRLINIRDPADPYSVADFRKDALREMDDITAKGNIPLLVGGTMLYFKALIDGLANLPEADPILRKKIEEEASQKGWQVIHQKLAEVDPVTAASIHPNHSQRISRAWEVYLLTGESLSSLHKQQEKNKLPYQILQFSMTPPERHILHQRIEQRFHQMIKDGFIEEIGTLFQRKDLHKDLPAIRAVGYRQAWEYLSGNLSREEMIERAIIATRQLAKRQITWLRGWDDLNDLPACIDPNKIDIHDLNVWITSIQQKLEKVSTFYH